MKKTAIRIGLAAIVYLILFLLAATSGLIHPACFAYAGTVLPLFTAFVYLYVAANFQSFGAATILNGFVLILALLLGEADLTLIVGMVLFTALAEIVRVACGYDTLKGVRLSFIPFAFSYYAYTGHWWTDSAATLQAAVEEMSPQYAEMAAPIIENIPLLVVMLVLVIPVAILGMRLAEKVLKDQTALLS